MFVVFKSRMLTEEDPSFSTSKTLHAMLIVPKDKSRFEKVACEWLLF